MSADDRDALAGIRREPPPFRTVAVQETVALTPRMIRIALAGEQLVGFAVERPAASVRLLLPGPGTANLEIPTWNGNEFLLSDGSRPAIRTLTPLRVDGDAGSMDVEIVVHQGGAASGWAADARPGDVAAVSGPGRGYEVDGAASAYVVAGDETALPAIGQLVETIPRSVPVHVIVEIADSEAKLPLPPHPALTIDWVPLSPGSLPGTALLPAIEAAPIAGGAKVWVAGEAAAMHRVRRHLSDDRGMARRDVTVRGYWKHGR